MYFDSPFRHVGTIDPEPLVQVIESMGETAWNEYVVRQELFEPHRHTHTIPLLFDLDGRHENPTPWPRLAQIKPALEPALEVIRQANMTGNGLGRDGYFVRIILTRLKPGSNINPHRDGGYSMLRSHRYHLALTTNNLVEFEIAGESRHFAAGEIWEINNREEHAVRNLSGESRIHVILDYVVPGERVPDPEGVVIA
jgi:hypothetical protein